MKILIWTATALLLGSGAALAADTESGTAGRPSAVLTENQCQDAWTKVKGDRDALISPKEAKGIVINFQQADTNKDGKVTEDEFRSACKDGFVHSDANAAKRSEPTG